MADTEADGGSIPDRAAALEELIHRADSLLDEEPPTVVNKTMLPPSEDVHDYMSLAPYYWPNPETPDGKPWVEREGEFNYVALEGTPDKPAIYGLIEMIWVLGQAHRHVGRSEYAEKAAACLRTWFLARDTRMNPNLNFAQGIPGVVDGQPVGVLETREFGKLLTGTRFIEGAGPWKDSDSEALKVWIREFIRWLRTSPLGREAGSSATNQATWYSAQAAAMLAFCGDELEAAAEVERGKDLIAAQIDGTGRQPAEEKRPNSRHHSLLNLVGLCRLARVGDQVGVDLWNHASPIGGSMRGAIRYLLQNWNEWPDATSAPAPADKIDLIEVMYHAGHQYGGHYEEAWRAAADRADLNPLFWDDAPAESTGGARSHARS